jgi:hypothetical protein
MYIDVPPHRIRTPTCCGSSLIVLAILLDRTAMRHASELHAHRVSMHEVNELVPHISSRSVAVNSRSRSSCSVTCRRVHNRTPAASEAAGLTGPDGRHEPSQALASISRGALAPGVAPALCCPGSCSDSKSGQEPHQPLHVGQRGDFRATKSLYYR